MNTRVISWAMACALVAFPIAARAQTVREVIPRMGPCQSHLVRGLADQLLRAQSCAYPDSLVYISHPRLSYLSGVSRYGAPEMVAALYRAADRHPLTLSDAFRSVVVQYAYRATDRPGGGDGCFMPAGPGQSRHEWGNAVDIPYRDSAVFAAMREFTWYGPTDPVHFIYGPERRGLGIRAFQRLWNVNHPEARLSEDGIWGPMTEARLLQSPANGFPRDGCSVEPPPPVDRDGDGSPAGVDCDDGNARNRPGGVETCDGGDNDCDTRVDEGLQRVCGTNVGACETGTETCARGSWGACTGSIAPTPESCDLVDNDCDGAADEESICTYEDAVYARTLFAHTSTDVDGDGDADACARTAEGFTCLTSEAFGFDRLVRGPRMSREEGFDDALVYTSLRMGDVDGDQLDDVCTRLGDRIVCWGATPMGFVESVRTMPLGTPSPGARSAEFWLADIDGDARQDLCARGVDGLRCQPSNGGAFRVLDTLSDEAGFDDVERHASIRFGDVNGDGREDVCARDVDGLACWLSSATGFDRQLNGPAWSDALGWNAARYGSTIRLVDVDADGRADACGLGPDGFACLMASERGWNVTARGPAMASADGFDDRSVFTTIRMADVDGDGASDVCARTHEGVRCWLWTGESFSRQIEGPALSDAAGWNVRERYTTIRLADVSGDGRADLCARASDGLRCWLSEGTHFERQWRGSAWSDANGFADPSINATLSLGGVSTEPLRAMEGACTCRMQPRRRAPWGALVLLAGLLFLRRRRTA